MPLEFKKVLIVTPLIGFALWPALACAAQYAGYALYPLTLPNGFVNLVVRGAVDGQVIGYAPSPNITSPHAFLWSNMGMVADLSFDNTQISNGFGLNASYQVGASGEQPVLWQGSADSAVMLGTLSASSLDWGFAISVGNGQEVGWCQSSSPADFVQHATLWIGTGAPIDLNPPGYLSSAASGVNGGYQVGAGAPAGGGADALLWSGSAGSFVDLQPVGMAGVTASAAVAVGDGEQVGFGYSGRGQPTYALLWYGTASSAVDLQPPGNYESSEATGLGDGYQVGYAITATDIMHAMAWASTANSFIDLNTLLPAEFVSSEAYSIDAEGNIFGVATDTSGNEYAVEWSEVPEPVVCTMVPMFAYGCFRRRRQSSLREGI